MEQPQNLISVELPASKFSDYLNQGPRMIMSGAFGIGKTHFIKDFFANNSTEYAPIFISPANYSVANNEDIFELIKYDIVYELLKYKDLFETNHIDSNIMQDVFLQSQFAFLVEKFVDKLPKILKSVFDITKFVYELENEYIKFNKKHIAELSELKKISKYSSLFTNKQGSIYEQDFYSELINTALSKLQRKGLKVVLIVDDVDRIDPDHIFRILNVFSAHLDIREGENKFNFDSIILVCDINNIKHIYRHKYGAKTDFSGYIDKFFSKSIYHYDNRLAILDWLRSSATNRNDVVNDFLYFILENLVSNKLVALRSILKAGNNKPIDISERERRNFRHEGMLLEHVLETLYLIFQDIDTILEKINTLANIEEEGYAKMDNFTRALASYSESDNNKFLDYISILLLPPLIKNKAYIMNQPDKITLQGLELEYIRARQGGEMFTKIMNINGQPSHQFRGYIPIWKLLSDALAALGAIMKVG